MVALDLPTLVTAIAILVASVTSLIVALRGQAAVTKTQDTVASMHTTLQENGAKVTQIVANTDGAVSALRDRIDTLQATHQETLISRIHQLEVQIAAVTPAPATTEPAPPAVPTP